MRLSRKTILLVSPEPWGHLFVSKHHYAIHLAQRGNKVYFLNPPGRNTSLIKSEQEGLNIISYEGFPSGMRYFPSFLSKWITRRVFNKLESIAGVNFDIIWSFDNSVFYQMGALPRNVFRVSHIVDINMDFQTERAAQAASICLCSTSALKSRLEKFTKKVHQINHGFSLPSKKVDVPLKLRTEGIINVGYAGNLDIKYLDWSLIKEATYRHKNIQFYFAGSVSSQKIKNLIDESDNMHHIGVLHACAIQSFFEKMDILMLAYLADEYPDQLANPHKVLEYLYSGKPIVATLTQEYEGKDLMYMSKKNAEWLSIFEYVISHLEMCSSKELADKRKSYALEHTYDKQIDRIEKLLASLPA